MLPIKKLFTKILQYLGHLPPQADYQTVSLEHNSSGNSTACLSLASSSGGATGFLIIDSSSSAVSSLYQVYMTQSTATRQVNPIAPASASTANFRVVVSTANKHQGDIHVVRTSSMSSGINISVRFLKIAGSGKVYLHTF